MEVYFFWGSLALLTIILLIGFFTGLIRGVKRSALHLAFFVVSMVVAFFIAKPIAGAILNISIGNGQTIQQFVLKMITEQFDISKFSSIAGFVNILPQMILAPLLFMILSPIVYFVVDIIYLIVARVSFGKKRVDFNNHKPFRAYGGVIGILEALLFVFLVFAPITSLTTTYSEIMTVAQENVAEVQPTVIDSYINSYNSTAIAKMSHLWNFDDLMFDGLTETTYKGEKIVLRRDLTNYLSTVNTFSDVYNKIQKRQYSNIDIATLKSEVEKILNSGLFKTVVSGTIEDFINDYDDIKVYLKDSLQVEIPTYVDEIVAKIKEKPSFSAQKYLKENLLGALDAAQIILKEDTQHKTIIDRYTEYSDKNSLFGLLQFVQDNNESVKAIAQKVLGLEIVEDSFSTLGDMLNTQIKNFLPEGSDITINTEIENMHDEVDKILVAVEDFLDLKNYINIEDLFSEEVDMIKVLTEIKGDVDKAMQQLGTTFDSLRDLQILIKKDDADNPYMFDKLLSSFNINLLHDTVRFEGEEEDREIETYTDFFNYISKPVEHAKTLNLFELLNSKETDVYSMLSGIISGLKTDPTLFANTIMPFYNLTEAKIGEQSFKELIFDQAKATLGNNDMIAFDNITDDYDSWNKEFLQISKALVALDKGDMDDTEGQTTYLKYLLGQEKDFEKVLEKMQSTQDAEHTKNHLQEILDEIFKTKSFSKLNKSLFDALDTAIGSVTSKTPTTFANDQDVLKLEADETLRTHAINTINELAKQFLGKDFSDNKEAIVAIGEILEILRVDANNDGAKDGVFKNIFANVIWYMTNQDISGTGAYSEPSPLEQAGTIYKFIQTDVAGDFYTFDKFPEKMKEVKDGLELAENFTNALEGHSLSSNPVEFVTAFKTELDGLGDKTAQIEKIQLLTKILSASGESLVTKEDYNQKKTELELAIDTVFKDGDTDSPEEKQTNAQLRDALKNLFKTNIE